MGTITTGSMQKYYVIVKIVSNYAERVSIKLLEG